MEWVEIVSLVLGSGSVTYLLIDKLFSRRHDRAEAKSKEVETGSQILDLYKEIDVIVQEKLRPVMAKQDETLAELLEIKQHWCCYRQQCPERLLYKSDDDGKEG